MNLQEEKYSKFSIVKEMFEVINLMANYDLDASKKFVSSIKKKKAVLLTGEGSSRIFPAKRAIYNALEKGFDKPIFTEGSTQVCEYELSNYAIFGASNSGKTKELIELFQKLKENNHDAFFGMTANKNTPLEELALMTNVLSCGKEDATAATKSVVEQALFYDSLLHNIMGERMPDLDKAAKNIQEALTIKIDDKFIEVLKNAPMIYFAGRNNGVAEELTLKTNEITRKKSDYLEGTYLIHGIEEVMNKNEALILIDPFKEEEEKIEKFLVRGVGINVIAISDRDTLFPTVRIPYDTNYKEYIELACGWNILVETGISLGIDLDHPVRARKIGNEM